MLHSFEANRPARLIPKALLALILICSATLHSQTFVKITDPKRQFDFWLGEWELTWPGEQSGLPAGQVGRGTNSIKAILDNCVIEENFVDLAPNSLRGMSVSVYNQRLGKWQQTWVDNQNSYLDFAGEFKNGKMILSRQATTKEGKAIMQRMVWHNIARDQLDWNWEASQDGGKTWKVNWQIHYKRKK